MLKTSISFLIHSDADDIAGDNVTVYEDIVLDEGEIEGRTDLSVPNESDGCCKDSPYVKVPLPISSGYIAGIQYTSAQQ